MTPPVIHIQAVNESTVVTDEQVLACVNALQAQLDEDYTPHYGLQVQLVMVAKGVQPNPRIWELVFADNSDQADALGYHETTVNGDPIGFCFVQTAMDDGASWTVTASHELLEMCVDPGINAVKEQDNADGSMTFHFKEVCDPCEDDSFGYAKPGHNLPDGTPVLLSDFVLPHYWDQDSTLAPFDFQGHIASPLTLLPNGYTSVLQVPSTLTWSQITADGHPGGKAIRKFNRRARHAIPRHEWKRSER